MARKSETFILKEFIVGLIVLLFFLFIFLFIVRKFTGSNLYQQFFPSSLKNFSASPTDYCGELGFGFTRESINRNFIQKSTRAGFETQEYTYVLSTVPAGSNSFLIETVSTNPEVVQEKRTAECEENAISIPLGNLLISSVLNVFPNTLSEFANYTIPNQTISLITREARIDNKPWENSFILKGGIDKSTNEGIDTYTCFITEAQGISTLTKQEEKEDSVTKGVNIITTNWIATTSADLTAKKSLQECNNTADFNQSVKVEVEETLVFSEQEGIQSYSISPRTVVGQAGLLPNGYIPVSFDNTIAPDPTPTETPSSE